MISIYIIVVEIVLKTVEITGNNRDTYIICIFRMDVQNLAIVLMARLDREVAKQKGRIEICTRALGGFATWLPLMAVDMLQLEVGFFNTCRFVNVMVNMCTEMVGSRVRLDSGPYIRRGITVHQRAAAETCRKAIIDELKTFPEWLEARIAAASPPLQRTIVKYINAVAFVFHELASTLHDRVLSGIAEAATSARQKWLDDSWLVDDS